MVVLASHPSAGAVKVARRGTTRADETGPSFLFKKRISARPQSRSIPTAAGAGDVTCDAVRAGIAAIAAVWKELAD